MNGARMTCAGVCASTKPSLVARPKSCSSPPGSEQLPIVAHAHRHSHGEATIGGGEWAAMATPAVRRTVVSFSIGNNKGSSLWSPWRVKVCERVSGLPGLDILTGLRRPVLKPFRAIVVLDA